jgi:signal transduction histidine kinase
MRQSHLLFILVLLAGHIRSQTALGTPNTSLDSIPLPDLEQRLETINSELDNLARLTLRRGVGNIGWISGMAKHPRKKEWAQIDLAETNSIDEIVLAPILWNDAEKDPQADGFPQAFDIIAGTDGDSEGHVIAHIGPNDHFLPRAAPLVIPVPPTDATWVRVQSAELSTHNRGANYRFQLSEIMIFSGHRNVALHQPVRVSSITGGWGAAAIYKEALVDGLTPYLMDASGEVKNYPYMAFSKNGVPFSFTIDLESSPTIDGIRLHRAGINEYIPEINPSDFGMPKHLTIHGANSADFSDAVLLLDYQYDSVYQTGNILEWHIPPTDCRYVRLSAGKDDWPLIAGKKEYCISLGEIEILSNGQNTAKNKPVSFPQNWRFKHSNSQSLTDGKNHFGTILPIREWMEQLDRRHDLETERPLLEAERTRRYAQQKATLRIMTWLAALLAGGTIIILLTEQVIRQRVILKTRERIAANLHDELGANLHAIGMLGDLAKAEAAASDRLTQIVTRIRELTERTGNATRSCTNMLESKNPCDNLIEEMKHTSYRLLADIDHDLSFNDENIICRLKPKKRTDLFLFYKECLTNILRHSGATHISTCLKADRRGTLQLIITDNGHGTEQTPGSLKRRARMLQAKLTVETPDTGGTRICLTLRPQKGLRRRKLET